MAGNLTPVSRKPLAELADCLSRGEKPALPLWTASPTYSRATTSA